MTDEDSPPEPGTGEFPTADDLPDEPLTADDVDPVAVGVRIRSQQHSTHISV